MSDPMTATQAPGASPPAVAYAAAQVAVSQPSKAAGASTTVASAEAQAIQKAATAASDATKLELSPATGVSNEQHESKVMTMAEAAEAYQSYLKNLPSDLQFQPDWQAGIVVFKVVNPVTQKVIRQLPPEEVVQQARNIRLSEARNHSGILLDKTT